MRVGFTGTREGCTEAQRLAAVALVYRLGATRFDHGDCRGADEEVSLGLRAHAARSPTRVDRPRIIGHPTGRGAWRSVSTVNDETREPRPPLERNHDIVDETEVLVACPRTAVEQLRSGTWATIRYARLMGRLVYIVRPDGSIQT